MTSSKQTLLATVFAVAGAASLQANASVQWSFDIGGCNPDTSTAGNSCTFEPLGWTVPPGQTALDANVTAWANTGSGGGLQEAIMKDWGSNGAGVAYTGESPYSPQHAMDNQHQLEFMLFDFQGQEIQLTDVTLGWETDSDLTILAYTGAGAPDLSADFVKSNANGENLTGTGGWVSVAQIANADYSYDFSSQSDGITSSYWIVGTFAESFGWCDNSGGCGEGNDHVKLWDVGGKIFETPNPPNQVSAPATALLLCGLLPLIRRRRR